MPLREVTLDEIIAAGLRRQARELILAAEALEAKAGTNRQPSKHPDVLHEEFRRMAGRGNHKRRQEG
jgi:hypothetical protein